MIYLEVAITRSGEEWGGVDEDILVNMPAVVGFLDDKIRIVSKIGSFEPGLCQLFGKW